MVWYHTRSLRALVRLSVCDLTHTHVRWDRFAQPRPKMRVMTPGSLSLTPVGKSNVSPRCGNSCSVVCKRNHDRTGATATHRLFTSTLPQTRSVGIPGLLAGNPASRPRRPEGDGTLPRATTVVDGPTGKEISSTVTRGEWASVEPLGTFIK